MIPSMSGGDTAGSGDATPRSRSRSSSKDSQSRRETDEARLKQRQKQVDFGRNTPCYEIYCTTVSRCERTDDERHGRHPITPDIQQICSKRSFDGQVRKWRRLLHCWDDELPTRTTLADDDDQLVDIVDDRPSLDMILAEKGTRDPKCDVRYLEVNDERMYRGDR